MKEFRFAIMGAANIANKFCQAVKEIEGCVVTAVASKSMERAEDFAKKNELQAAYDNYEKMIEVENPQAVYIAVTADAHYALTMLCLEKGIPVLCEKAMFLSGKEAKCAFTKAKQDNIFVMEAMWSRFLPAIKKAKEWNKEGFIGKVACADMEIGFVAPKDNSNRYFNPQLGGGAAYDITVYAYEIPGYVLDRVVDGVQTAAVWGESGVDVTECAILRMGDILVTLRASFAAAIGGKLTIYGEEGKVVVPNPHFAQEAFLYNKDGELIKHYKDEETTNGFVYEIKEVITCVQAGQIESAVVPHSITISCAELFDQIMETKPN